MEDLEGRSQPEEFIEHQDIMCGVVQGPNRTSGRQESLLRQLSDDGPQSIDGEAREQLKELVLVFEDTFAVDENELGCAQDVAHTIDTTKNRTEGERGTKEEERQGSGNN